MTLIINVLQLRYRTTWLSGKRNSWVPLAQLGSKTRNRCLNTHHSQNYHCLTKNTCIMPSFLHVLQSSRQAKMIHPISLTASTVPSVLTLPQSKISVRNTTQTLKMVESFCSTKGPIQKVWSQIQWQMRRPSSLSWNNWNWLSRNKFPERTNRRS
jgi:hypothetical protein